MVVSITHSKTNNVSDWTQADLNAQIALGNFAAGTVLADIVLPSDWNHSHVITGLTTADVAASTNKNYVTDAQLTVIGNTSGTNTGDQTSISGNAGTATALQTARNINGVSFNGTGDITVTAAAGTLTGATLAAGVTASSLTSVGTIATGTWNGAKVSEVYGGTNQSTYTTGDILAASGANTLGKVAVGAADTQLVGGTTPTYATMDGWASYTAVTPTTGTLATPNFNITFAGVDLTGKLSAGMRVKITQATTKYFIIMSVSFSTNTTVVLYGGTDYSLVATATTAISAFWYSTHKAPFGFPLSHVKWSVAFTDGTGRFQSNPDNVTFYNPGNLSVTVPIGEWNFVLETVFRGQTDAAQTAFNAFFALSTANNANSDSTSQGINNYIKGDYVVGGASATLECRLPGAASMNGVVLAASTIFYFICWSTSGTAVMNSIGFDNGNTQLKFRAVCAYL